jgi:hypothetical protein
MTQNPSAGGGSASRGIVGGPIVDDQDRPSVVPETGHDGSDRRGLLICGDDYPGACAEIPCLL